MKDLKNSYGQCYFWFKYHANIELGLAVFAASLYTGYTTLLKDTGSICP